MSEKRRLFLALWPDDPTRKAVVDAATRIANSRRLTGRKVPPERVHLTLLFLGDVEPAAEARLCEVAATVRARTFDLTLDQTGCFFRSRVFWVGPQKIPAGMLELWERLRAAAEAAGIVTDYKALVPHLTCLRDIRDRIQPVPIDPIRWRVREFALVHSTLGPEPRYHVVSHWPLQTSSA